MKGSFGDRIRELRLKQGMTLKQVADELEVRVSYLSDVEHGRKAAFNASLIHKVAKLFEVDGSELLKLSAKEKRSIEIPPSKNPIVNRLAFALARPDRHGGDFDEEVSRRIKELLSLMEEDK